MTALLEMSGVDVRLGHRRHSRRILHDVALRVDAGEIVGVIGETGSGKTTLARTVLGLVDASRGSIRVSGQETRGLSPARRRDLRRSGTVQFVFQDSLRSLDPDRTIADSIAEGLRSTTGRGRAAVADIPSRVDEALELVGLDATVRDRRPGEISGGQRQRVAIARAIACRPELLICDEPVSALDASNRNKILRLLADLRDELGIAIVVIAHDLGSLAGIADRVVVLYRGEIVEDGPIHDVFARPHHPYTGLLLASAPTTRERPVDPARLQVVCDPATTAGNSSQTSGDGCVFAARCPFATDECGGRPTLIRVAGARAESPNRAAWRVACHHDQTWWAAAHRPI